MDSPKERTKGEKILNIDLAAAAASDRPVRAPPPFVVDAGQKVPK